MKLYGQVEVPGMNLGRLPTIPRFFNGFLRFRVNMGQYLETSHNHLQTLPPHHLSSNFIQSPIPKVPRHFVIEH
jgi:hypothetical protein